MRIQLSELTPQELDDLTDTMTDAEIGRLAGTVRTAATNHRKKWGIRSWSEKHGTRKYKETYTPAPGAKRAFSHRIGCREDCFASIRQPEQAYWLGLLAADGWIVTQRNQIQGVALALHSRDMELLKSYAEFIGFRAEPRRTRSGSEMIQVKVASRKMAEDLNALGIEPRKSRTIKLPKIEAELMRHFLRGLFDGDGSVQERSTSLTCQITTASKELASGIKAVTDKVTPRPCSIGNDREAYVLRWYADNALSLAAYMYDGSPETRPRMERKARILFGFQGSGAGHSWGKLLSGLDSSPSR
jgi:hypothetical protein